MTAPGVAVVTGPTSGIGRWIALGLAQAGHTVVLVARDKALAAATREWIVGQAPGAAVELVEADLSSVASTAAGGAGDCGRASAAGGAGE